MLRKEYFEEKSVREAVENLLGYKLNDYQWKMVSLITDTPHQLLKDLKDDLPRIQEVLFNLDMF